MDQEWERLRKLYAGLSDNELLNLADSKGELTDVAQQAVDAEMVSRGLAVESEEGEAGLEPAERQSAESQLAALAEIGPEGETPASWLRKLTYEGVPKRFPDGLPEAQASGRSKPAYPE